MPGRHMRAPRWLVRPLLAVAAAVSLTATLALRVASGAEALPQDEGSPAGVADAAADTLETLAAQATAAVVLLDVETPSTTRQGSGFIVDPKGRIITNNHVIRDARGVRIKLASGDVYDHVTVLVIDERRDIAILQVPGFELPTLPLGNSDSVRIGAPIVLIGSPLGLENTVSTGIVSGRRREKEGYEVLQISAPASPGSSGGPVLSRRGEVIGVAVSQVKTGQNLNFALPINYVRGLLAHLGETQPVAILPPRSSRAGGADDRLARGGAAVNRGLRFDLDRFGGFAIETEGKAGEERTRRTRVTVRRIETIGSSETRLERYAESETTERRGPFGTPHTVRRERSRTIAGADDLKPVSARGEIAWWTGEDWRKTEYDIRFDGDRIRGVIRDTAGQVQELDRDLPPGILLRELRHVAFATLAAESLPGRSVELVTFDPRTGEIGNERYDVGEVTSTRAAGQPYRALRVNVASGLSNSTALFRAETPRILLRRESEDGEETEEVTRLELFPPPRANRDEAN